MLTTRSPFITLAVLTLGAGVACAEPPVLPDIFSDHMVLQRDGAVRVWGTAGPRDAVTVEIAGHSAAASADDSGRWLVELPASPAGGPHTLSVTATGTHGDAIPESVSFEDVLFGDVWIASGQSNMQWALHQTDRGNAAIVRSGDGELRLLSVNRRVASEPDEDSVSSGWSVSSPETTRGFSAVAYYFGRDLRREVGVPIGLVHTSWGGTLCEAWTPVDAIKSGGFDTIAARIADHEDPTGDRAARIKKEAAAYGAFFDALITDPEFAEDPDWRAATVPGHFEKFHSGFDGMIAFERTVTLSDAWSETESTLSLGPIDDFDAVFINGVLIDQTGHETPGYWSRPRVYTVPSGVFTAGDNTLTVYAIDTGGAGGFFGDPGQIRLSAEGLSSVPLAGDDWRACVVGSSKDLDFPPYPSSGAPNANTRPGCLYNAMIHPLRRMAVTGAIWYQGESNANRAEQYRTLFPNMIESWRDAFDHEEMPFFFVQLANFKARVGEPQESAWAELREAQAMALALPNTGMAVTIDIGVGNDIHPRNKLDVGRRLALGALETVYGKPVVASGPTRGLFDQGPGETTISYEHAAGLRTTDGRPPRGFEYSTSDGSFVRAEARIDGDTVVLSTPNAAGIVEIRYAWADNPDVNLVNGAGLPAVPFRTDSRPGLTDGRE